MFPPWQHILIEPPLNLSLTTQSLTLDLRRKPIARHFAERARLFLARPPLRIAEQLARLVASVLELAEGAFDIWARDMREGPERCLLRLAALVIGRSRKLDGAPIADDYAQ